MPKLRNASTELSAFTQWLGRKCRNHNPLAELNMEDRSATPDRYTSRSEGEVSILSDEKENVLIYRAGGRVFVITVEEFDVEMWPKDTETIPVGY